MTTSYALRGVLPGGGLVQAPLAFDHEPSLDEAKERHAGLVALMPEDAVWTIETDEKPDPKAVRK